MGNLHAQVAVVLVSLHQATRFDVVDFPEWGCEGYVAALLARGQKESENGISFNHVLSDRAAAADRFTAARWSECISWSWGK